MRHRVAAQQFDAAVRAVARPVAGDRVPHAVDDRERRGRLGRVALVAERNITALGQPAHPVVTPRQDRRQILGRHEGVRAGVEGAGRHRPRRRHVVHLRPGLRRSDAVDDDGVRQGFDQALLDERGQQGAAVGDHGQRRHVGDALLDGGEQRARHRVSDHRHHRYPLTLDGADHVVGVQMIDDRREDDGSARWSVRSSRSTAPHRGSVAAGSSTWSRRRASRGHDLVERTGRLAGHRYCGRRRTS